jgi:hypothetical protein
MNPKQRNTLDERIAKDKTAFLDALAKQPIVSVACERSGVSKPTYHRWKAEDEAFAKAVDEAIVEGKSLVSDVAKAQLISLMRDKNFQAIKLWLTNNDPDFKPSLMIEGEIKVEKKLSPEEAEEMRRTLEIITDMMLPKGPNPNDYDYERHLADIREHGV